MAFPHFEMGNVGLLEKYGVTWTVEQMTTIIIPATNMKWIEISDNNITYKWFPRALSNLHYFKLV